MNDFIFNVLPTQGPTVPMWVPIFGGFPLNSPLVGSFLGVLLAFILNYIWQFWNNEHLRFEEEYRIKAELKRIEHDLGGKTKPIKPVYGAGHVIKYRLFGKNRTEVIGWYVGFERYNSSLEDLKEEGNHPEIENLKLRKVNEMGGILHSGFLKRIPDDDSDLSKIKFIRYLLKLDAMEEPTRSGNS
jgi:hypothetical protein